MKSHRYLQSTHSGYSSVFRDLTPHGVAGRCLVCKRGSHMTGIPKASAIRPVGSGIPGHINYSI